MAMPIKHVGFKGAVNKAMSEGYKKEAAMRIIGYAKAHASPEAKKRNPALKNTRSKKYD